MQGGVRAGFGSVNTAGSIAMPKRCATSCPSVAFVSPVLRRQDQVVAGNLNWGTLAQGVAPEFQQIRDWQVAEGRFLHEGDMDSAAKVAVIGQTVARQLFGNDDPSDAVIRIRNIPFRVVGVLGAKGQTGQGTDQDDTIMIPYTTMQKRLMRITWVQSIVVKAVSAERRRRSPGTDYFAFAPAPPHRSRARRRFQRAQSIRYRRGGHDHARRVMAVLLGSVASISLLVGGIGIMNIMLVSVTERTREIGIRMAVGARSRDIMLQFLVEAVVMAATGGLIGILLGVGSSEVIKQLGAVADSYRSCDHRDRLSLLRRRRRLLRFLPRQEGGQLGSHRRAEIRVKKLGLPSSGSFLYLHAVESCQRTKRRRSDRGLRQLCPSLESAWQLIHRKSTFRRIWF